MLYRRESGAVYRYALALCGTPVAPRAPLGFAWQGVSGALAATGA
jgi:hypothetical protein